MAADEDERRLIALGRVAENSANLEMTLRMALCALVGSKYAAIVAAGQQTAWLIEQSRAIVKAHREISPEDRARLIDILEACAQANASRRTLIHHAWGTRPPDDAAQLGSSYRDYRLRVSGSITAEHVESVAHE